MQYELGTFVTVPNKEKLRGLPAHVQAVYFWVCSYTNEKGECFPSRSRLAQDAGISLRSTYPAIEKLIEIGILKKVHRFNAKKHEKTSNLYKVIGSAPPALPSAIQTLPSAPPAYRTKSSNQIQLKEESFYEKIKREDREIRRVVQ